MSDQVGAGTRVRNMEIDAPGLHYRELNDRLREAVEQSSLPVVAIGGITAENLASVRATGVHAWAVISAILAAPDVAAAAMDLG